MKVLQINSVCGVGSTGKICQDIYWALKQQGHECKVAWGRRKGGSVPDEDTIKIGNNVDFYLHALSTRIFDNTGFCSSKATRNLIEQIKCYNPDVIHIHNIHGYYINIQILFDYLKCCEKKIIWTLHDCWPFTGHCTYMDFIGCNRWKTQCFNCPQKKCYPRSDVFDRSILNYKAKKNIFTGIKNLYIVTPSRWLSSLVKCSFLQDYPVISIPNGIDLNVFKPTKSNFRSLLNISKKIILAVANQWDARKGYKDLLKLSNLLLELNYIIVIIGLNNDQLKEVAKFDNIIGIAKTDNQFELVKWYTVADIFFNPTYEDNYPTVNLEAQACGVPVVSYLTGGSPESLPEENCIQKGDLKSFIDKLEEKLEVADVESNFDMTKKYLNIYENS